MKIKHKNECGYRLLGGVCIKIDCYNNSSSVDIFAKTSTSANTSASADTSDNTSFSTSSNTCPGASTSTNTSAKTSAKTGDDDEDSRTGFTDIYNIIQETGVKT